MSTDRYLPSSMGLQNGLNSRLKRASPAFPFVCERNQRAEARPGATVHRARDSPAVIVFRVAARERVDSDKKAVSLTRDVTCQNKRPWGSGSNRNWNFIAFSQRCAYVLSMMVCVRQLNWLDASHVLTTTSRSNENAAQHHDRRLCSALIASSRGPS